MPQLQSQPKTASSALTHLDLFAGIGGFTLAAERTGEIQTTQFVEIDPDAQTVLRSHWPNIPIHDDIRTYHATDSQFDLITGGFPCTNTSSEGDRTGLSGDKSSLWWEMLRVINECKPKFVVIENVEGFITRGLREVLASLRMAGYQTEVELISAAELGACHRRRRIFVVAYSQLLSGQLPPCWSSQIGCSIARVRNSAKWLVFERRGNVPVPRFPPGMDEFPLSVLSGCPGRIRTRYLVGRSVSHYQAQIALDRVFFLNLWFQQTQ